MSKLLLPPEIVELEAAAKVIFLAGPIQGAIDWQSQAVEYLQTLTEEIYLANPRRHYLGDDFFYEAQVDWETHYLRRAAAKGTILFWLSAEHSHHPQRAYAQTTRFELAEWKIRAERDQVNLVLGIEAGFSNSRYIRRRFAQDAPRVPILDDLDQTCQKAVELAQV